MVFDAIMNTDGPLLIIGTSEGGAIVQKCMESAKLARHMRKHGMRVALLSPAYALGDASIAKTPFYRRAGLSERRWWVDQERVYAAGVPMHIINNDIGFASMQHMAVAGSAEAGQYEALLAASLDSESFVTWDFLPGAPHSCAPALPSAPLASADEFCWVRQAAGVQRAAPRAPGPRRLH